MTRTPLPHAKKQVPSFRAKREIHLAFLSVLLYFFASLFPAPTSAQTPPATGTPPFGSFGGGPDVINLGNLNVHLDIPVLHKPGRGTNFMYDLSYDSSVWYPVTSGSTATWQPTSANNGWTASLQYGGYTSRSANISRYYTYCGPHQIPLHAYVTTYTYSNWVYVDGRDIAHPYPSYTSSSQLNGCTGDDSYTGFTAVSPDGSGYKLTVNGPSVVSLYATNGGAVNLGGTVPYQDRNGNQITLVNASGTSNYYDTLSSTTPVLTVAGSGTSSSPIVFSYTPPNTSSSRCASTNTAGVACYTMNYTNYTVATNFGVSGISEYKSSAALPLVSSIVLPDGTQYTFAYEATPSTPPAGACTPYAGTTCVTARLSSVTLPTGGTITYAYSGGNNGILPDGSAATLTRTTPDGTWTYVQVKGTGAASTTTITDPTTPTGNQSVLQFQGIYETERQLYQGSTSGTLLRTDTTCYNGNTSSCNTTAITLPITQRNVTTQLPGANNLTSLHIYKYNGNGSLIEQDDYDYGSGAAGPLLKKTAITFASLGSITKFRQTVTVTNGSGATVSQTNYNYDQTGVVATSGTPQQTSVTGSRGNLTSINYYTQGSTYLTRTMSYFDTGKVQTVTDSNNAQTTYTYGACGNSFPTGISEPLSLSKSMTWNCTGGVRLTTTDENNQTTTTAYSDPYFWRSASVTDPTSAATSLCYGLVTSGTCTLNPDESEATLSFNSGSSATDVFTTRDGLGRPHLSQLREAPGSANFDTTETDYDASGRPSRTTLPYVGTAGQTNSSAPAKTVTYDALNRTLSLADNSGGSRTFSYSQNDIYITRGPAPSGENTKRRQEEFDGLGRLTSVCEITAGTTSAPAGTCAQNTSQTGYWTKYSYDALGRLTGVSQNAQSSNPQARTFVYDLMGRLTSETNPESGTTTYAYDTDSTCGTSNGDRVKKTDAVGNVSCYAYDSLHRPTAITYPSGTYAAVTPAKHFVYDSATVNGQVMSNVKDRLAEAYTCTSTCTTKLTDVGFSYTVRGEPSDVWQSTPNSGGYYHLSATYWANGAPNQLGNNITSLPSFTFAVDGEGRPYQVSVPPIYGQNPVTNTAFNAASLATSVTYGSGDADSFSYDSNTNRLTQYQFTVNGQSETGVLTWNANHTLQSQNITDPFNSSDTQNCAYSYDDLSRLTSVNCGTPWSQTFSYDAFGNISKSGTYSFQPIYKNVSGNTTNQFVSIPGATVSYDANGNVLGDGSHTYAWDSSSKAITVDSVNATYDALGRMVEQNRSGTYTQFAYGPTGAKLAILSGQTLQKGLLPLPGGGIAVYNTSGLLYYGHPDHLGSMRLGSTSTRSIYFDLAFAPFGETYVPSGTTDPAFTGQRQDTVAGLYDFPERQYSTQGRWPAPDPAGLNSMHLADPQTLNRYAYVRNNPLVLIDPQGLDVEDEDPCDVYDCLLGGGGGGGGSPDPTSGGDPSNSGGDCSMMDPTCGGNGSEPSNPDPSNSSNPNNVGTQCPPSPANCGPTDGGIVSVTQCDDAGNCQNTTVDVVLANPSPEDALNPSSIQVFSQVSNMFPDFLTEQYHFPPSVCTGAKFVFVATSVVKGGIAVGWIEGATVVSNPELAAILAGAGLVLAVGC